MSSIGRKNSGTTDDESIDPNTSNPSKLKYTITSSVSLSSSKNSLTTCEVGDIEVKYDIPRTEYDLIMNSDELKSNDFVNEFVNIFKDDFSKIFKQIPANPKTKKPAMTSLEVCVPRKCNDGSHPINIKSLTKIDERFKDPFDVYVCASPGIYQEDNDNEKQCKNGGGYMEIDKELGMCIDLPKYYFKNFQ